MLKLGVLLPWQRGGHSAHTESYHLCVGETWCSSLDSGQVRNACCDVTRGKIHWHRLRQCWPTCSPRGDYLQPSNGWIVSLIKFTKHNRTTEHNLTTLVNSNTINAVFLKIREIVYKSVADGRIIKNCVAPSWLKLDSPYLRDEKVWYGNGSVCRILPQINLIKDRNL